MRQLHRVGSGRCLAAVRRHATLAEALALSARRADTVQMRLRAVMICAAMSLAAVGFADPASAAGACGSANNYHAGRGHSSPQAVIGVMAVIDYNYNDLCTGVSGQNNAYAAWAMLQELNANLGYAQAGYLRWQGASTFNFSEYNECYSCNPFGYHRDFLGSPGAGASAYWVYYSSTTGHLDMNVGFSNIDSTNFNPYLEWSSVGGTWSEEAFYRQTDIPGTSADPTKFADLMVQPFGTSSLVPNTYSVPSFNANSPTWLVGTYANNDFRVWTSE